MSEQFLTERGKPTTADDPNRLLWYSASCGYWTDDWSMLSNFGPGIPCCPNCGCPGMQVVAGNWFEGAVNFENEGHPNYVQFVNDMRATCLGRNGWMEEYKRRYPE